MSINIQYLQMETSETLSEIVTRNLQKLAHKYQFVIHAEVLFKLDNTKDGKDKICEIELSAPGPRIFAKSNDDNFEKAAAETLRDLDRQLRKRKEKFSKHEKLI